MAKATFRLKHGIPFGKGDDMELQFDVELRELQVGDILAAQEEAEKVVPTPNGYTLVVSPTLAGIHTLRRQIVRIGKLQGPISPREINLLQQEDLALINRHADALDKAVLSEVTERGRSDSASG